MADYIRREDALFSLRKAERGGSMTALTRLERAYAEIREMPAADVAEVVRCKDCKHRTEWGNCGHPRHHGIFSIGISIRFLQLRRTEGRAMRTWADSIGVLCRREF